jgi:hypothetical protein
MLRSSSPSLKRFILRRIVGSGFPIYELPAEHSSLLTSIVRAMLVGKEGESSSKRHHSINSLTVEASVKEDVEKLMELAMSFRKPWIIKLDSDYIAETGYPENILHPFQALRTISTPIRPS